MTICSTGLAACALAQNSDASFVLTELPASAGEFFNELSVRPKDESDDQTDEDSAGQSINSTPSQTATRSADGNLPPIVTNEEGCINQASAGRPIDVNIPDDTIMEPGQDFSKTWRLINAGTCTWTEAYQVIWFWGSQMGQRNAYALPHSVSPGEEVEITVNLTAPVKTGTYQSSWKLRSPEGKVFGVGTGEGLYFYVRIVVANTPGAYATPSTHGGLPTATPYAGGPTRFLPNDRIDLDKNQLNPSSGEDIAMNGRKPYYLVPFEGAYLSIYGKNQPGEGQCLATAPSKTPIQVNDLEDGTYLCYLTGDGRTGWMRVKNFWYFQNKALFNFQVYTYPLP